MNVEIGAEAAQFPEKEYINGIAVAVYMKYIFDQFLKNFEIIFVILNCFKSGYTVKKEKVSDFPIPDRVVTNHKLSLAGNNSIIPCQEKFG
jgi:hypothetical protein